MFRRILVLAPVALMAPGLAHADPLPLVHPTRDVAVTYRIEGSRPGQPEQSRDIRMFWGDDGQKLRVEIGGERSVAIVDFPARRIRLLVGGSRLVVQAPFDERMIPGFVMPKDVSAHREGAETVAGIGCTLYALRSHSGTGRVCVTGDGLVLRAGGASPQGSGTLEAISVAYGPQPASLFAIPEGGARMDLKPPRQ